MFRTVLVTLIAILPQMATADGIVFQVVDASIDVKTTAQRAVMWNRNGTWEIHIQPVFPREPGSAAWVVPFPVRPTVSEGSADFFDQLELATAPVFLEYCRVPCCAKNCDGGIEAESLTGKLFVAVWERGTVGYLEYVILSSTDGDNMATWLRTEGFDVPADAESILDDLTAEGLYFFAAKLSPDANPDKPLTPVRFILPGMDPPTYPLRLTRLGVPAGEFFELTLWIIYRIDQPVAPHSHHFKEPDFSWSDSRKGYDDALDRFFEENSPITLAVLYSKVFNNTRLLERVICPPALTGCVPLSLLFEDAPESWCEEIVDIYSDPTWIARYQARFDVSAMAVDLTLEHDRSVPEVDNILTRDTGLCRTCPDACGCEPGGEMGGNEWIALATIWVLWFLRRRV